MCLDNRLKMQYRRMLSYVDVYVSLDSFCWAYFLASNDEKQIYIAAVCLIGRARFYSKADELGSIYLARSSSATRGDRGAEKAKN